MALTSGGLEATLDGYPPTRKGSTRKGVFRKGTGAFRKGFHYGSFQPLRRVAQRELRNFQTYVIYEVTQNHIFFTSFTSNYSFFTLLTLPLWLSTPPYPHLPLFYPPSRLDGYSTGTRRVIWTPTRGLLYPLSYYPQ